MIFMKDKNFCSESVMRYSAISVLLVGMSFYSNFAEAGYVGCTVNSNDKPQDGVFVAEYGVGDIGYAGYDIDSDNGNGIYVRAKSPVNGALKSFGIDGAMNLNDDQGQAMLSALKTALVTGVRVKLSSNNNCRSITSIIVMDH